MKQGLQITIGTILAAAAALSGTATAHAATASTTATSADVLGGWSEKEGDWTTDDSLTDLAIPNHRGISEYATINGTSHKRAHGWTTWAGTYHYTTAQLEHYWPASGVITTSGRRWNNNGSEAVTQYVAFNPNAASNGYGEAKTYYGK